MNTNPKISVIMPVYNGMPYLPDAVDSILGQTYEEFEFIIIDDAGSDGSYDHLMTRRDDRIRLYRNERNAGQTKTLNRAIGLATGEFIARMDQDDISLPKRFERQVRHMLSHPDLALLGASAYVIDCEGRRLGASLATTGTDKVRTEMVFNNPIIHSTAMIRKKMLDSVGAYMEEFVLGQDYDLWARIVASGASADNIREPLLLLRMHDASATVALKSARFGSEASAVIRTNARLLAGVELTEKEAIDVCGVMNSPTELDEREMENGVAAARKIQVALRAAGGSPDAVSKFMHFIAVSYLRRGDVHSARREFMNAILAYPFAARSFVRYIMTYMNNGS